MPKKQLRTDAPMQRKTLYGKSAQREGINDLFKSSTRKPTTPSQITRLLEFGNY